MHRAEFANEGKVASLFAQLGHVIWVRLAERYSLGAVVEALATSGATLPPAAPGQDDAPFAPLRAALLAAQASNRSLQGMMEAAEAAETIDLL